MAGVAVQGQPAEDDLPGVEDDGLLAGAHAAAYPALRQLDLQLPVAHAPGPVHQVAAAGPGGPLQEGGDGVPRGLGVGGQPAALERIACRQAATTGPVLGAAEPGHRRLQVGLVAGEPLLQTEGVAQYQAGVGRPGDHPPQGGRPLAEPEGHGVSRQR